MLVYYFVPFIVSNRYLLFCASNGHNSVTVQNWTHVYMNFFHHKDLGNHLLQLCPKVVKHPVYVYSYAIHNPVSPHRYCIYTPHQHGSASCLDTSTESTSLHRHTQPEQRTRTPPRLREVYLERKNKSFYLSHEHVKYYFALIDELQHMHFFIFKTVLV